MKMSVWGELKEELNSNISACSCIRNLSALYVCHNFILMYEVCEPLSLLRGGPLDTQGGGGLCKFSKTIIWLSLIKK